MIKETIISISKALSLRFNNVPIYVNELKQGFSEPCFFIIPVTVVQDRIRSDWYLLHQRFDIHYYEPKRMDALTVGANMYDRLEYITFTDDKPIRGINMNYQFVDGVLHFFVDYDLYMRRPLEDVPFMMHLEEGIKENGG